MTSSRPNPANGIPRPKVWKTLPEYLEVKDVEAMLQWIEANPSPLAIRDKAIVLTLFASGLRSSELINLKLEDVSLDQGFVKIWNGKGAKDGIAPLNPQAVEALTVYLQSSRPAADKERSLYVFLADPSRFASGGRLDRQGLHHRFG